MISCKSSRAKPSSPAWLGSCEVGESGQHHQLVRRHASFPGHPAAETGSLRRSSPSSMMTWTGLRQRAGVDGRREGRAASVVVGIAQRVSSASTHRRALEISGSRGARHAGFNRIMDSQHSVAFSCLSQLVIVICSALRDQQQPVF